MLFYITDPDVRQDPAFPRCCLSKCSLQELFLIVGTSLKEGQEEKDVRDLKKGARSLCPAPARFSNYQFSVSLNITIMKNGTS